MSVTAPSIVPVARGGESCHPLSRIHEMDPANLVGEAVEHEHVFHVGASTSGELVAGVWSCTPCTERIHDQTYVVLDPVTGSGGATDAA